MIFAPRKPTPIREPAWPTALRTLCGQHPEKWTGQGRAWLGPSQTRLGPDGRGDPRWDGRPQAGLGAPRLRGEVGRGSRGGHSRLRPSWGDDWSVVTQLLSRVFGHPPSYHAGGSHGPWLPPSCRRERGSEILHSTRTSKPPAAQAAALHPCTPPYLSQQGQQGPGVDNNKPQRWPAGAKLRGSLHSPHGVT